MNDSLTTSSTLRVATSKDIRSFFQKVPKTAGAASSSPAPKPSAKPSDPAKGKRGNAILDDEDDDFQFSKPVKSSHSKEKAEPKRATKKRNVVEDSDDEPEPAPPPKKPTARESAAAVKKVKRDEGIPMDSASFFADSKVQRSTRKVVEPESIQKEPDTQKSVPNKSESSPLKAAAEAKVDGGRRLPWAGGGTAPPAEKKEKEAPKATASPPKKEAKKPAPKKKEEDGDAEEKPTKKSASGGPSNPGSKEIPDGEENCLMELSSISRDDASDIVKRYGGRVTGSVSGKTTYVVTGDDPGESKIKKAKDLKAEGSTTTAAKGKGKGAAKTPVAGSKRKAEPSSFYADSGSASTVSATTSQAPKNGDMWTIRYKPKSYDNIMGNKKNVERLATWLKRWSPDGDDKPGKDDPGNCKAILISGPPGIGKTTAAHLVAELEGYEAVEFNASDTRSKKSVNVGNDGKSPGISEYFTADAKRKASTKKVVLIMDEVDGMSSGDRGGVGEPMTSEVEKAVKSIALNEGLDLKLNVVDNLVKSTQGDIRQILNLLQNYALQEKVLTFDGAKSLSKRVEKNTTMGPFDATAKLFSKVSFREMTFAEKSELYFTDYSLMPLMVQENYVKMDPAIARETAQNPRMVDFETLGLLSSAADSIANGDIIDTALRKTMSWTLMPLLGITSTVRPCFFTHGSLVSTGPSFGGGGGYSFSGWLGKNSTSTKSWRQLKEIQMHMRLRVSADKNELRHTYLPLLARKLTVPLVESEQDGIPEVIDLMDSYYLTREDWDSVLELGLGESGQKVWLHLSQPVSNPRSPECKLRYNKSTHPQPLLTPASVSKVRAAKAAEGVPDLEEAVEADDDAVINDDDNNDDDDDDIDADRLIKKQKAKGRGGAASGRGRGRGKR
ncbi:replication factor RFC1 C terminal domain-containing protein [Chytridium lagenaria]|nr:replication factor RFC1 C terminal domain-containing protein [Chytridium lagenaria]